MCNVVFLLIEYATQTYFCFVFNGGFINVNAPVLNLILLVLISNRLSITFKSGSADFY